MDLVPIISLRVWIMIPSLCPVPIILIMAIMINSYLFVICPLLIILRVIPGPLVISGVISPVGVTVVIMGMLPINVRLMQFATLSS